MRCVCSVLDLSYNALLAAALPDASAADGLTSMTLDSSGFTGTIPDYSTTRMRYSNLFPHASADCNVAPFVRVRVRARLSVCSVLTIRSKGVTGAIPDLPPSIQ